MRSNFKLNKVNIWWWLLTTFAFARIALYILDPFLFNFSIKEFDFKIYLHFTFQANLMGLIIGIFLITKKDSINVQNFKILSIVSLLIACIVFWTIIFPERGTKYYTLFSFIETTVSHGLIPFLIIIAFLIDCKNRKNSFKLKMIKTTLLLMIFPILWLIMAVIIYYTIDYPIYSFLDFNNKSIFKIIIYITTISVLFISFSIFFIWLNNKYVFQQKTK